MKRFTEAEYVADRAAVIRHAIDSGETVAVVRPDGSARVVISIPKDDLPPFDNSFVIDADVDATEHRTYEKAIAILLADDTCFLTDGPNHDGSIGIAVNVNDCFGPGSDAEVLPYREIGNLWRLHRIDAVWGPLAWAVARRKQKPWRHRSAKLTEAGFDVDALVRGEMPTEAIR